jgi:acyl carrier protein
MKTDEIFEVIARIARERLGFTGALSPEMRLVDDLKLDSVHLLTLAVEVENRFRIALDEADEAALETVGDLAAAVRRKLAVA